ncbi:hypothetical protein [Chryseobacterium sp. 6424]|nr:hypothetical protein [Chryseobacterium sp. 6424]
MKKLLHRLFSYKTIPVTDAETGRKEIATYSHFMGFPLKPTYKPLNTPS